MTATRKMVADRPAPVTTADDAPFWDGVKACDLRLPACKACRRHYFPPGPSCPRCGRDDIEWKSLGAEVRGRLHSFTIVQRSFLEFAAQVPYVVAIVELEGVPEVRMTGNLLGTDADPKKLTLDAPLRLVWAEYANGTVLPQWELA